MKVQSRKYLLLFHSQVMMDFSKKGRRESIIKFFFSLVSSLGTSRQTCCQPSRSSEQVASQPRETQVDIIDLQSTVRCIYTRRDALLTAHHPTPCIHAVKHLATKPICWRIVSFSFFFLSLFFSFLSSLNYLERKAFHQFFITQYRTQHSTLVATRPSTVSLLLNEEGRAPRRTKEEDRCRVYSARYPLFVSYL